MSKYTDQYIDRDVNIWKTQITDYHSTPQEEPGILRRVFRPGWGDQIYRYIQNKSDSAFAVGDCVSFVAPVAITDITSGTTTSITKSATFVGDNEYQYDILYCADDNSASGAGIEGEFSIIISNTVNIVYIDPDIPFSVAAAANDDFTIITYCHCIDAAASDTQQEFAGVAVSAIPDNYWGWVQCAGLCPYVTGTGSSANADLVAQKLGTKVLVASSTTAVNLLTAVKRGAHKSDTAATKFLAELKGNITGFGPNQMVSL